MSKIVSICSSSKLQNTIFFFVIDFFVLCIQWLRVRKLTLRHRYCTSLFQNLYCAGRWHISILKRTNKNQNPTLLRVFLYRMAQPCICTCNAHHYSWSTCVFTGLKLYCILVLTRVTPSSFFWFTLPPLAMSCRTSVSIVIGLCIFIWRNEFSSTPGKMKGLKPSAIPFNSQEHMILFPGFVKG